LTKSSASNPEATPEITPLDNGMVRIMFEGVSARAHFVQLNQEWQEITRRHDEPPEVMSLLGQMTAASVLLSASLKYDGAVVLQIHGDGPVRLAVAECNAELGFRSTIKMSDSLPVPEGADWKALVNQNSLGRFSVVLDPKVPDQHPYQGIVPLHEEGVAQALESYMTRSEQLPSKLWLACNGEKTAGLLLQRMPAEGSQADEDWARLVALASTITETEMLESDPHALLHRLFWQENPRLLDERPAQFFCPCSRERVARMLQTLGTEEIAAILTEKELVEVNCDFCNTQYRFDAVDCAQLFTETADSVAPAPKTLH
jgi:molecular chaperone Hsp33